MVWQISGNYAPNTWWPDLHPDFCQLTIGASGWDLEDYSPRGAAPENALGAAAHIGRGSPSLRAAIIPYEIHVCPGYHRSRALSSKCREKAYFYCKSWGYKTTGDGYWGPSSDWDYITVKADYAHLNPNNGVYVGAEPSDGAFIGAEYARQNLKSYKGKWCHPFKIQFTEPEKNKGHWLAHWIYIGPKIIQRRP